MKKLILILIIYANYLFAQTGNVFQPGDYHDGIYSKEIDNNSKKIIKGYPYLKYQFKEFGDTTLYNASVKEIRVFQKYSKPFINNERFVFINPSLQFKRIDSLLRFRNLNIEALKFYIDTATTTVNAEKTVINLQTYLPYKQLFSPFYILKTEVTNKEYREFITYVRDSLARLLLCNGSSNMAGKFCFLDSLGFSHGLKWSTPIPWDSQDGDVRADLTPLYLPANERYYNRQEIDSRKLNYEYRYYPNGGEYDIKDIVNVYPDTLCWVHDFINELLSNYMDRFLNLYQWHPAYDNYPVVGITFPQIRAFLHWKTEQMQRELNKKGIKFIVECDLPTELEWETTNSARLIGGSVEYFNIFSSYDKSILPDLYCKNNCLIKIDSGVLNRPFKDTLTKRPKVVMVDADGKFSISERFISDYIHYAPTLELEQLDEDVLKSRRFTISTSEQKGDLKEVPTLNNIIYFTHNNVSEWMRETFYETDTNYASYKFYKVKSLHYMGQDNATYLFPYDGNYNAFLKQYQNIIKGFNTSYITDYSNRIKETVKDYDKSYRLVRGANWYDSRSLYNGDERKTFVAGDSAHSTIGFRYVVRFKEKRIATR